MIHDIGENMADETDLPRLRATRAGNKGVVTKLIGESETILNGTHPLEEKARNRLARIEKVLKEKSELIHDLDEKIIAVCKVEDIEKEIEEAEDLKMRVMDAIEAISLGSPPTTPLISNASSNLAQGSSTIFISPSSPAGSYSAATPSPQQPQGNTGIGTEAPKAARTKLPKLTLRRFRGDVTQFRTFWDTFESTVHSNPGLTKIDKFSYLVSLLEGSASRAIEGLPVTEENYDSAVEILKKRFGKPQQLISAHMEELLKLNICAVDKPSQLRFLYDKISVNIRGLEALGVKSEQYGSLLIPIIMAKLPDEIRIQVARNTSQDVWEIDSLLDLIQSEIDAREMSEKIKAATEQGKRPSSSKPPIPTAGTFFGATSNTESIVPKCVYCNERHFSASCNKVTDINVRRDILRRDKRCFMCLKKGHLVDQCDKSCRNCKRRHHQSICQAKSPGESLNSHPPPPEENSSQSKPETQVPSNTTRVNTANTETPTTHFTTATSRSKGSVLLQTATAVATNEDLSKSTTVRILFDNGSQRSYVTDNLKSKLGLKSTSTETLRLNTFGETAYRNQRCQVVTLPLRNNNEYVEISALNFPVICSPLPKRVDVTKYPHLQDLELADRSEVGQDAIDVLIGSDHYWDIVTGESIRGENGPTAVNSKFGWLLSGPTNSSPYEANVVSNLIISGEALLNETNETDEIKNMLKTFWETESIGIVDDINPESQLATKVKRNDEISFNGRHYEVGLPWMEDCMPLSDNYGMCETRLRSLHYKLKKDQNLLSEYHKIIHDQQRNGIIERVTKSSSETEPKVKGTHYSPHHAVVRKDRETTKVRIVYDGSAKNSKEGRSLNDCLQIGDNYIPHIFDMLTKFRWNAIGLTADIEKAFLMVGIKPEDRDMLRFLWFEDPFAIKPEIVEYRLNRLVFGLRPSPSLLGATIAHHLRLYKQSEPEMAELLEKSLYIDDFITGEDDYESAFAVYKKSKQIMSQGGFNLRKWSSNSHELMKAIEDCENQQSRPHESSKQGATMEDDESYAKASTTPGDCESKNEIVKVLGLNWDTASDEFFFDPSDLCSYGNSLPATKRSVLKLTAKIFDPIGFLTPFTIKMKILFQELRLERIDWDGELQGNLLKLWKTLLDELKFLCSVRIPRCYFQSNPVKVELHGFSDASHRAYAAVVYMRSLYSDGRIDVRLVSSKSRVAPLKKQSIPRLELLGAVLLARLVNKFNSTVKQLKTINWIDSLTALCWIKNARTWKQYVQHRVDEIRKLTSKSDWRHCPGKQNPADLPSRGTSVKELTNNAIWWNGPEFLYQPETEWPANESTHFGDEEALKEAARNDVNITHSLVNSTANEPNTPRVDQLIDITRFSDLTKLLRVTALVVKFVNNLKNTARTKSNSGSGTEILTALELTDAEELWIKAVQASSFDEEIKFLRDDRQTKTVPPTYVSQFGLILENGIVKCKGRMNNAELLGSARIPILLPAKHDFVSLVIKKVHASVKHCGLRDTLTTIRERFWILKGREAVKRVIKKCVICLRINGMPYKSQPTPDLPSERVSDDPPFTHVGLDFAGPLNIVNEHANGSSKVYVCLFTCASTRAIHLELCRSLDVQEFLLAFRRFTSRRGLPATITSDNAKTFKSSSKEIRRITRSNEVLRYLVNQRISWNFIVERAPWWGGFWERLVRSVKTPLKKVLGRATLNFEQLRTLIVEIESVINARPITYVYDDTNSISYPLTPSDLVYGRRVTLTPNSAHHEIISTHQSLTRRARHHKNLLQQVTKQWRKEYLTGLREQSNARNKGNAVQEISVGDIVLLKNDSTNRIHWKISKVEELIPGADGKVRAAIVKVGNGDKRPTYLRRVIQHLIPIEVKSSTNNEDTRPIMDVSNQAVRPRRTAAVIGEISRRQMNIV